MIGPSFDDAVRIAREAHATQVRKGTNIPYIAHLLAVAALVLEDGGDEEEAIAALLHDTIEDGGGQEMRRQIRERFGGRVAAIVEACTDTDKNPKPPWRERKRAYLHHLRHDDVPTGALRVSLADKLHNLRAIRGDLREVGGDLWKRFTTRCAADQLWYFRSLADIFLFAHPSAQADELDRLVGEVAALVVGVSAWGPIRLWLDDDLVDRAPPSGWVQVTTAWEANALLGSGRVVGLSLDHDLGGDEEHGTGMTVVNWLDEAARGRGMDLWPPEGVQLHSANPSAVDAMTRGIESAAATRGVHRTMSSTGHRRFSFGQPEAASELTQVLRDAFEATVVKVHVAARTYELRRAEPFPDALAAKGILHVITAHNPNGEPMTEQENVRRHCRLIDELRCWPGIRTADAEGRSRDGRHSERSVAVWGLSQSQACEVGRRHGQLAIFEADAAAGLCIVVLSEALPTGREVPSDGAHSPCKPHPTTLVPPVGSSGLIIE